MINAFPSHYRIPAGKYKGKSLHNIPSAYLEWAVRTIQAPAIVKRYRDELDRRARLSNKLDYVSNY